MKHAPAIIRDPWESLKQFTAARIALGRAGSSMPLKPFLELKLAHAHARDAVYSTLDKDKIINELGGLLIPCLMLQSKVTDRHEYLQRPNLGRLPNDQSKQLLEAYDCEYDICIIVADGLSAKAVNTNAAPLIKTLLDLLLPANYRLAPICIAEQARVALADHVGYLLKAHLTIVLIGERPGLSAADSMGAYLTYNPKPGLTDESRNCISNIRQQGLSLNTAAKKIFYLVTEAFKQGISGISLKDNAALLENNQQPV